MNVSDVLRLVVVIVAGLAAAAAGIAWVWKAYSQPAKETERVTLLEKRLDSEAARYDRLNARYQKQEDRNRELGNRIDALEAEQDTLRHEYAAEVAELRAEMAEWQRGMSIVFEQMRQAKIEPVWKPEETKKATRRQLADDRALADYIIEHFDRAEIDGLAFDVGITSDEISGDTREARAKNLIGLTRRMNKLPALKKRAEELRRNE